MFDVFNPAGFDRIEIDAGLQSLTPYDFLISVSLISNHHNNFLHSKIAKYQKSSNKHLFSVFRILPNLEVLLLASKQLQFQIPLPCCLSTTTYERLKYLFCDTPNIHPLPLFQASVSMTSKIFFSEDSLLNLNIKFIY